MNLNKITGPRDATLALALVSYVACYLAARVACEIHGFANPQLARERAQARENAELAELAKAYLRDNVATVEAALR